MAKKRAASRMVEEDDPQWVRFWELYPHRVAKKEARKAWAELAPSPEMVDRMIRALEWQVMAWAQKADWYTPPYPASWLRAERWDDEAPKPMRQAQAGAAAIGVLNTLLGDDRG